MRIVVEPGSYACHNMGDVAMMQVAVSRLKEFWPHAVIEVVTARPDLLLRFCPSVAPLAVEARNAWLSGRSSIGGLHWKLPAEISAALRKMERQIWLQRPEVSEVGVRLKAGLLHRTIVSPSSFRKRLAGADLLVISGAGMLNDAFADTALPLLDELEYALYAGIPVVAFGQGIGPMTQPSLLAKARAVLPRLKMIGLREGYAGLPLLESLGVPRERIHVTGDDAIDIAYRRRPGCLGKRIGVNLRLAQYAGMSEEMVDRLREPLHSAARKLNSALLSVPISLHASDSDVKTNAKLLETGSPGSPAAFESPEDVIRLIGDCRVVVTGSYHGGVFALAQGIPVVGLVCSSYYEQKFTGLQQQFSQGCRMIDFRRPVTSDEIQDAILTAWESAQELREPLFAAAARQVELGRAACQSARGLFPLKSDN
jgi:colanic acid/amylovoran biosynthesis protein